MPESEDPLVGRCDYLVASGEPRVSFQALHPLLGAVLAKLRHCLFLSPLLAGKTGLPALDL